MSWKSFIMLIGKESQILHVGDSGENESIVHPDPSPLPDIGGEEGL